MARFTTSVRSPKSVDDAFAYMADLRNFAEWDPGVKASTQIEGDGPGPEAAYDVEVDAPVGSITMRYRIDQYDAPSRFVTVAETATLRSVDTITVAAADTGSGALVTYEAELTLKYGLGIFDPLLQMAFDRIGNRAAKGLQRALDGERVS